MNSTIEAKQDMIADHAEEHILENLSDFVSNHEEAVRRILTEIDANRKQRQNEKE